MHRGFVKLHRKLNDWEWKRKPLIVALFTHLLINASYKDTRFQGYSISRGQLVTGRKQLSIETGMTEQQVRTALNLLKSTSDITIKSTSKFSIISITNYESYQDANQQTNQQLTNKQPTTNQQLTTSKEGKEYKKVKNKEHTSKDIDEACEMYNALADKIKIPKMQKLTKPRKAKLNARLKECGGLEGWGAALCKIESSAFLSGSTGWVARFDWIIKQENFIKIMEGNYDDRETKSQSKPGTAEYNAQRLQEWVVGD